MADAQTIAETLGGAKARRSGQGWMTLCPCHDDHEPSLSVAEADDGTILLHCFAGCEQRAVFNDVRERGLLNGQAGPPQPATQAKRDTPPPWERPVEATYDYVDEHGELLCQKLRFGDGRKPKYQLRSPTADGGWQWSAKGVRPVLYRLPQVLAVPNGRTLVVCEGERDADNLAALGVPTTSPRDGASSEWRDEFSEALAGKRVVILPDNDEPGRQFAERVAAAVHPYAQDVRVVHLPVERAHEDVSDWIAHYGGTLYHLQQLAQRTPFWQPAETDPNEGWPQPADVLATIDPPELDTTTLPKPIQPYVREQAELTGCDPAVIALTTIVCGAAAIHDGIQIQPKRHDTSWRESARLWGAIVGDPSTKKSPGMNHGLKPIRRVDYDWVTRSEREIAEWQEAADAYKQAKKKDEAEHPGDKPPKHRLIVEDTTVEALSEVLIDNPRGVLVHHDELATWFGSMDAYSSAGKGGKDRGIWLQAYNGGPRNVDRIMRGHSRVPNMSASLIGGIQPNVMRKMARDVHEDGLLQRMMVVCVHPAGREQDRPPDRTVRDRHYELFEHVAHIEPAERAVTLDEAAHAEREALMELHERHTRYATSPHLQTWIGKWPGLFARLCLTWHVFECAAAGVHPTQTPVTGDTAASVRRFIEQYLYPHALWFYTELVDSHDRQDNAQQIAAIIVARGWLEFTRRDLTQAWKRERRLEPWQVPQALETLEAAGWIEPSTDEHDLDSRRRPRRYFVNPRVHEQFRQHAERERLDREERQRVVEDQQHRMVNKGNTRSTKST